MLGGEGKGHCQSQPEHSVRRELYPYVVGMENSMCVPVRVCAGMESHV